MKCFVPPVDAIFQDIYDHKKRIITFFAYNHRSHFMATVRRMGDIVDTVDMECTQMLRSGLVGLCARIVIWIEDIDRQEAEKKNG